MVLDTYKKTLGKLLYELKKMPVSEKLIYQETDYLVTRTDT